ncbi:MAG: L-threonylcarbamoyladenylate synthase [Bacteroidota bacterium]|jgi:L-threonylcarbamoyladenylate synthase|nr:L-threonylcarbamoyladenylate synthase [Bacteroidota bacterium]
MTVQRKGMKSEFGTDLAAALKVLRAGGVILYPTDTIWGLGCDATNAKAVRKIYEIKHRAENKSLIILVNSVAMLERYIENPPGVAIEMAELSEKPLTMVYDRGRNLAEGVASSDGSVGARICAEPFCDALIEALRKPLVSTSANISGSSSPAIYDEISEEVKVAADYVCLWRQDDRSRATPSPVIRISGNGIVKILRR